MARRKVRHVMKLAFFALRRIGLIVPTLLLVSVLVFSLQHLLPGDPAIALSGDEHDPAVVEHLRQKYGFNRPLVVQYGMWLSRVLASTKSGEALVEVTMRGSNGAPASSTS